MFSFNTPELWLGTENSLLSYYNLLANSNEQFLQKLSCLNLDGQDNQASLYNQVDDTAIISIKGNLVGQDVPPFLAQLAGLTTYPSLQQAFYQASEDDSVRRVVLDINSSGGTVQGIEDTLSALRSLAAKKPVATFIEECHSAAYWLGSVGEKIVLSKLGSTGSIGVILFHKSLHPKLEQDGVDTTVIRTSPKKCLMNSYEKLSEEAKTEIREHANYVHNIFVNDVAKNRRLNVDFVSSTMADGGSYFGSEAINRRFADSIGTFQSLLSSWQSGKPGGHFYQSGSYGATSNGDSLMTLEESELKVTELQAANTSLQAKLAELKPKLNELSAQLSTLTESNTQLAATNKALSEAIVDKDQITEGYSALLKASITSKANALNVEVMMPEDLAGLKAMDKQLDEKFQTKFPNGGVAITDPNVLEQTETPMANDWKQNIFSH